MDSKKLAAAVRRLREKVDGVIDDAIEPGSANYDDLKDARALMGVLAHIVDGKSVVQAFGAPGDWGYGTPIGDAIASKANEELNMTRVLSLDVEECGEDCHCFEEDTYATAIHGCSLCDDELPAEMFQEMSESGEKFPECCPLPAKG